MRHVTVSCPRLPPARADDFYNAFLGSTMVYTSGVRLSENDTLVQMQYQKIDLVCQKIQLQRGERLLDIGCGWGSLSLQATKNYGVRCYHHDLLCLR